MRVLSLFDGIGTGRLSLERAGIKVDKYYASEIDKNAITIAKTNYSDIIELGSVLNWRNWDIEWNTIDLLIGGSPCFVSGTLVMTDKGMKPIEEIQIGDYVLTHKSRYKKVLKIGNKTTNEIYNIKGMGFDEIKTTANHPFYVREKYYQYIDKGNKTKEGWKHKNRVRLYKDPQWLEVSKLDVSKHYLGTTYNINLDDDNDKYTEDFWYFVGRFVGDGWIRKTKRKDRKNSFIYYVVVCCGKDEFNEVKEIFDKLGYHYNYSEERTVYKFRICSKDLVNYLINCGCGAINKCVHPDVWKLPKNKKKAFLDGYISADGHYNTEKQQYSLTSISRRLIYELKLLIAEVYNQPIIVTYNLKNPQAIIEGRTVNQHNSYTIRFKLYSHKQDKSFFDKELNSIWAKMTSVKVEEKETIVYNLEVEDDNSYTANGMIVHNCTSFSSAGKQQGFNGESKLFYEYRDILNHLKSINPNIKFLLENVIMKKEWEEVITNEVGVKPILIDSSLLSAQQRKRNYWFNWKIEYPEDKHIELKDILDNKDFCYKATIVGRRINNKGHREDYNKNIPIIQCLEVRKANNNKSNCLTTVEKDNVLSNLPYGRYIDAFGKYKENWTYYSLKEYCRLQTLPDNYCDSVPEHLAKKAIGNGWTADVITHIFKGLQ